MAVKFDAPIDSITFITKSNSDNIVIEVVGIHLDHDDAVALTDLINSGESLEVKIKKSSE